MHQPRTPPSRGRGSVADEARSLSTRIKLRQQENSDRPPSSSKRVQGIFKSFLYSRVPYKWKHTNGQGVRRGGSAPLPPRLPPCAYSTLVACAPPLPTLSSRRRRHAFPSSSPSLRTYLEGLSFCPPCRAPIRPTRLPPNPPQLAATTIQNTLSPRRSSLECVTSTTEELESRRSLLGSAEGEDDEQFESPSAEQEEEMRRRALNAASRQRRLAVALLFALSLALVLRGWLLVKPTARCQIFLPRAISHRGFDIEAGEQWASSSSVIRLLRAGISSFDLDLFWTADKESEHYIGHPPSLLANLRLPEPMSAHTSGELLQRIRKMSSSTELPLTLSELLRLARAYPNSIELISLELKEPGHALWTRQLHRIVDAIRRSGMEHKFALMVDSAAQGAIHRRVQAAIGVSIALHQVVRDRLAPKDALGRPYANLTSAAAEAAALGVRCNGWSVSSKLLQPNLGATGSRMGMPVDVWVVDDEVTLQRAVQAGVAGVVSNRPLWLQERLRELKEHACPSISGSGTQG